MTTFLFANVISSGIKVGGRGGEHSEGSLTDADAKPWHSSALLCKPTAARRGSSIPAYQHC
jgi:hypothetical protein